MTARSRNPAAGSCAASGRHPARLARGAGLRHPRAAGRDAAPGYDHGRGQERLRPRPRPSCARWRPSRGARASRPRGADLPGAHEVPLEYRGDRARLLRPARGGDDPRGGAARPGRLRDVFCEQGVSRERVARILAAARAHGLKLRVHADELGATGVRSWRPAGRALGRPPGPRLGPRGCGARPLGLRGHAAAGGGLLPAPPALRAGPGVDRRRRRRWPWLPTPTRAAASRRPCRSP